VNQSKRPCPFRRSLQLIEA